MTREEKIEIMTSYFGTKTFAEIVVDKMKVSDERVLECKGKVYEPLTND